MHRTELETVRANERRGNEDGARRSRDESRRVSEKEGVRGSRAIQKGEQPRRGRVGDERGRGREHSRPAPVVKRNGAKRTRRTSLPAAWEEEIERREGNGPLERALANQREQKEEGEGGGGEMRVRRNELKRNAREYTYISRGLRETPKEAREDKRETRDGRREGKSEEGRRGREKF